MEQVQGRAQIAYRIVTDPYGKWITIEAHESEKFKEIVYDSRFLDFRKLRPQEQVGWRREAIDNENAWIYNEEDRLILKERFFYSQQGHYRLEIYSPHRSLICYYVMEKGPIGPLKLYDAHHHIVMSRRFDSKQEKMVEEWGQNPRRLICSSWNIHSLKSRSTH